MSDLSDAADLRAEIERELTGHLLPFWLRRAPDDRGGFVGRITQDGRTVAGAAKGGILNMRLLWTFATLAADRGRADCRRLADRGYRYLEAHFVDPEHDGVYWMLDAAGRPVDTRKHVYVQAFAVYALAAYHRATGLAPALGRAVELFHLIETHARDDRHGGYHEAFARDWTPLDDVRLSEADAPDQKSTNTHLHVLEAYAGLYRIWPETVLRDRLAALVNLFLDHILDPDTHHGHPFFDAAWTPTTDLVSYGHDIETCWLLVDAAEALGDADLHARAVQRAVAVAHATLRDGVDADGGLFFKRGPGDRLDTDKHWWPQAEAVVGFLDGYRLTGEAAFLEAAAAAWTFIQRCIVDRTHGEWLWGVRRDGTPIPDEDKVGPWKGPYHNVRACLEAGRRLRVTEAAASVANRLS